MREDEHIRRVLAKQNEIGFEAATGGELRRRNFMSDFTDALEGFDLGDAVGCTWQSRPQAHKPVSSITGIVRSNLRQVRPLTGHELPFLKANSALRRNHEGRAEQSVLGRGGIYPDRRPALQLLHGSQAVGKEQDRIWGVEPREALDEAVRADNACLRSAKRNGVTLGIHLCRGNNRSHWFAEGGYEGIAEKLFGTLDVTRIGEASRYVPMKQLALSPQCGFASTAERNLLTEDRQWEKLKLVVDAARRVWN